MQNLACSFAWEEICSYSQQSHFSPVCSKTYLTMNKKNNIFNKSNAMLFLNTNQNSFLAISSYYYLTFIFCFSELCFLTHPLIAIILQSLPVDLSQPGAPSPFFLYYSSSPYFIRLNTCFLHPKAFQKYFSAHLNLLGTCWQSWQSPLWKWKVKVTHLCLIS